MKVEVLESATTGLLMFWRGRASVNHPSYLAHHRILEHPEVTSCILERGKTAVPPTAAFSTKCCSVLLQHRL